MFALSGKRTLADLARTYAHQRRRHKNLRPLCGGGVSRNGYCHCSDQNGMTKQAYSQNRVTSDGNRKSYRPHPAKHLKHRVPDPKMRNMTKRAHFVIEYIVPHKDNQVSQETLPFYTKSNCFGEADI